MNAAVPNASAPVVAGPGAPSPQTQTGERIPALDGLRGIAILLVLVVHYYVSAPTAPGATVHEFLRRAFSLSFVGVDLFFVLSGFLIGSILIEHRDSPRLLRGFYARRFFRIVPLYVLLLLSFFICREFSSLNALNRGTYFSSTVPLGSYLVFGQNIAMSWLRDIGPYWLGPSWSLAIEEQFYLLMPLIVMRLTSRQLVVLCVTGLIASPVLRVLAITLSDNSLAAVFLLPMRADGLLWGVLAALVARNAQARLFLQARIGALRVALVALVLGVVALSLQNFASDSLQLAAFGYTLCHALFTAVLLYVIVGQPGPLHRLLQLRPLVFIGVTSYFVYLFHTPIWYLLHWIFFRRPPLHFSFAAWSVTLLALGVTFGLGALSWRWLESPLLRLGRKHSYG